MENILINEFYGWLKILNKRMKDQLIVDGNSYLDDWTEEVVVPEVIYKLLPSDEKENWEVCDLNEIYSPEDVRNIFGVQPSALNKCFSKRFYKLTKDELEGWERFSQLSNTNMPINKVLIIYS